MATTGALPASVGGYISGFPVPQQEIMEKMRATIHNTVPGLTEGIRWGMPTFLSRKGKIVIQFAGAKRHLGLYPGAEAVEHFKPRLEGVYDYSKGTVRFHYGKPVDYDLISDIIRYRFDSDSKFRE